MSYMSFGQRFLKKFLPQRLFGAKEKHESYYGFRPGTAAFYT